MDTANALPIRRLTLYKHGVSFVERAGVVTGADVRLIVRSDDIDDVLKSLLVVDRRGGAITGVDYATPGAGRRRPGETFATVADDRGLRDLLRALRGWPVRLMVGDEDGAVIGRVLGIDTARPETPRSETIVALVDAESGAVRTVPLHTVRRVVLLDAQAREDLQGLLDDSRGEDAQRTMIMRLAPGEHDLAVSYLVPSPTWRVGYRVITEPGDDAESGTLLLQGWGLFDNHLEEDLDGVAVTLVAGQPISFVYRLSSSHIPVRPVVEDQARVAAAPVEYAALLAGEGGIDQPAAAAPPTRVRMAASRPWAARMAATIEDLSGQAIAASGSELGELFQYEVTEPVTVKRGASALVPILSATLPYHRELLYNRQKLPDHPVAALRFVNDSGLVLERGPVTIFDGGAYHGEAIVPFTKEGDRVYLAYAVELGIKVGVSSDSRVETAGIAIAGALLHVKSATVTRTTYRLESALDEGRDVMIEHALQPGWDLVETRAPDTRDGMHGRWHVACPQRGAATFVVSERRFDWRSESLLDQSYEQLSEYLGDRWLEPATLAGLKTLFAERAALDKNDEEKEELRGERREIYERQDGLRQNMAALGTTGAEGALRERAVDALAASEDRLSAIDARIAALQEDNTRRQAAIDAYLAGLQVGDAPA